MPKAFSILCFALIAFVGCHKKSPAVESPPPPSQAETPATSTEQPATTPYVSQPVASQSSKPLPPPPPSVAARAENYVRENVQGDPDPFLSAELRNFVQLKHRMPDSFSEFVNVRLDSIPRPPDGKKWVIDVATLQVKAVSAKQ
jgi:hypothetical protein